MCFSYLIDIELARQSILCLFIVERVSGMKIIVKNVKNFITNENHSDFWLLLVDKAVRFFRENGALHRKHFMVRR